MRSAPNDAQLELLPPVYPRVPGWKARGPSEQAARAVKASAKTLRDQVLELLIRRPLTADECAAALHADVLSVRPRLSELVAQHLIEDAGQRRTNHRSGKPATVWRAKP